MTVVSIGELVVDWLCTDPGQDMAGARRFYRSQGGNASNVAVGLSRLGQQSRLVGKVGNDIHGRFLLDFLAGEGVDLSFVITDEHAPTAQCYVITDESGGHRYYNWPRPHAADLLSPEEIDAAVFESASFLHASGISMIIAPRRLAVMKAFEMAGQLGITTSFDAAFPTGSDSQARDSCEALLHRADIIKFNEQELRFWMQAAVDQPVEKLAVAASERYRPLAVLVTLSRRGSLGVVDGSLVFSPAPEVKTVGEVGAGDAFIAGVLFALCRLEQAAQRRMSGLTISFWQEVLSVGNACGALATRALSASESLPALDEVKRLMGNTDLTIPV